MQQIHVTTRALERESMTELLTRHHVGRMAFSLHDHLSIVLANYLFSDGWIYSRMEMGSDLVTLLHNRWVAFEVDEVDGLYDWRTVSVNGSVQFLSDGPTASEASDFKKASELIQSVVPSVFTPADPMPQRVQLFRIFVDQMTGTEARSNAGDKIPSA